jgi:hypothetical protein
VLRLVPPEIMSELRIRAATTALAPSRTAAAAIVVLWISGTVLLATLLLHAAF